MQPLKWYVRRLRAMSPMEVLWRASSVARDISDRCLFPLRRRLRPLSRVLDNGRAGIVPGFRVTDVELGEWARDQAGQSEREWLKALLAEASQVAAHRLSFFDLRDQYLGDPIDWNRDHKSGKAAPMRYARSIDYRDFGIAGDCKFVWEPNRHQHLVVLGRAYLASGDIRYAMSIVEQMDSWLRQCPYGIGLNWRSPLELGIRLINWVWALDLIRESGVLDDDFRHRLLNSVYMHLWEISRQYSRYSSAGNHLIGEAAGVFIATSYLPYLRNARRWNALSQEILSEEITRQTYPDGGGREQALGYHFFILKFLLLAGIVGGCWRVARERQRLEIMTRDTW